MERKLQVFVSSTYTDLKDERQIAVEAILNEGHIPAGMELFKAGPTQEEVIKEWIEQSDIYILILGGRYGSLNDKGISYTEWEYDLAVKMGKPMFAIVLNKDYINQQVSNNKIRATDLEINTEKYQAFIEKVTNNLVKFIEHSAEITIGISGSIREIEKKSMNDLVGWIPGRYLEELERLQKENKELSNQLLDRQNEYIDMQKELTSFKDDYIGEYRFDFIIDEIKKNEISIDRIKELIKQEQESIKEDKVLEDHANVIAGELLISKFKKLADNNNLLFVLTEQVDRILNYGLTNNLSYYDRIVLRELIGPLKRFFIIEGSSSKTLTITENGFKFFNLLKDRNNE